MSSVALLRRSSVLARVQGSTLASRSMAIKATVADGFDSRGSAFFAPVDVVQRVFYERIKELEGEINTALEKPYTRSAAEAKEVESFLAAEKAKLGLTDPAYDFAVKKTVTGNLANFKQYVSGQ